MYRNNIVIPLEKKKIEIPEFNLYEPSDKWVIRRPYLHNGDRDVYRVDDNFRILELEGSDDTYRTLSYPRQIIAIYDNDKVNFFGNTASTKRIILEHTDEYFLYDMVSSDELFNTEEEAKKAFIKGVKKRQNYLTKIIHSEDEKIVRAKEMLEFCGITY